MLTLRSGLKRVGKCQSYEFPSSVLNLTGGGSGDNSDDDDDDKIGFL